VQVARNKINKRANLTTYAAKNQSGGNTQVEFILSAECAIAL